MCYKIPFQFKAPHPSIIWLSTSKTYSSRNSSWWGTPTPTHTCLWSTPIILHCVRVGSHSLVLGTAPIHWQEAFIHVTFNGWNDHKKKFCVRPKMRGPTPSSITSNLLCIKVGPFVKTRAVPFQAHIHISPQPPLLPLIKGHDFHTSWWGPLPLSLSRNFLEPIITTWGMGV